MNTLSRLGIVILAVSDVRRSVAFYQAALGWQPVLDAGVYVEFALEAGLRFGIYQREGFGRNAGQVPTAVPDGGLAPTELYLYVDDLPGAVERMSAAGARVLSTVQRRDWGDDAAYFADPDGNVLVLARPSVS